jgi:tetratricopeptide (TPR) repeat protein
LVKFSVLSLQRSFATFAVASAVLFLGACSTAPTQVTALMPPTYDDLMASAEEAQRKGGIVEAMAFYEKATKADPAKKQPWSRIAQAQFDARNYGSAITAAQEVLQRDTGDVTAKSIMAVSGLRVSANALEQLRLANALGGNTRDEAQTLARIMRDALGESILPAPAVTSSNTAGTPTRQATPPVRRVAPAPQVAPTPAPAPAAEPKRNPFDALKG